MIGNFDYNVPDTRHKNKSFERGPELFYVDALINQPANKKGEKSINCPKDSNSLILWTMYEAFLMGTEYSTSKEKNQKYRTNQTNQPTNKPKRQ